MTLQPQAKHSLVLGSSLLALAVLIGAFGAHGLKAMVTPEKLVTFETGVRYHFYHAFGILILGLIQQLLPTLKLQVSVWSFLVGILLFSCNCYFYVLTDMKFFAMIVPIGGLLFVLGWIMLAVRLAGFKT
jgi:uncharacterized membrane protein YgdD (TMEM256/DUF423 family)